MEAKIEALRKEVRFTKWITISSALLGIALRFLPQHLAPATPPPTNTNSVNIGESSPAPTSQREFLTVSEVAERENLSPRTITEYITSGRISPAPTRNGTRPWAIAADYRILPLTAANSGGAE